jgi:hypothetical protein
MSRNKILYIAIFALFISCFEANAQAVNEEFLPKELKTTFHEGYGHATEVQWRIHKGNYIVLFSDSGRPAYVVYDSTGWRKEQGKLVTQEIYPAAISHYLKKMKSKQEAEVYKVSIDRDSSVVWKATTKNDTIVFDLNGNYLETQK